jgi:small subunit ribosomal protein S17
MAEEQQPENGEQPENEQPDIENAPAETPQAEQPEIDPAAPGGEAIPASPGSPVAGAPSAAGSDSAEEQAKSGAEAGGEAPESDLSPKARRKRERSIHTGEVRPQRSPEERNRDRLERRAAKATARRRARSRARERRGEPGTGTVPGERAPGSRKVRQGVVVSAKPEKTITVRIEIARRHPVYEKVVRRTNTVHAHDERNEAQEGDVVRVVESRPLSRTKRWRLVEILERAR